MFCDNLFKPLFLIIATLSCGITLTIAAATAAVMPLIQPANILAVFPMPVYSHHSVYRVYVEALAARCHNITVIKPTVPFLVYNDTDKCGRIVQINADMSERQYNKLTLQSAKFRQRGVISDQTTVTASNYVGLIEMIADQFNNTEVRQFLKEPNKFDAVVVEAFAEYALVFGHLYAPAPVIQIAPGYGLAENLETAGAVSRHPIHHPNIWRSDYFRDVCYDDVLLEEIRLRREFTTLTETTDAMLKKQFGPNTPSVQTLRDKVELLLLNLHPIFDNNRAVPPSVQYLGGKIHLINSTLVKLDDTLEMLMNKKRRRVIYVSFGSSINTDMFADELKQMLINTFIELSEYTILWKINDGTINTTLLPPNVHTRKWFNQRAVLNHPNTVAFVTQGGVQSCDEALTAIVPMVCMPMMGDQFYHARRLHQLGVAHTLNTLTVTSEQLAYSIRAISTIHQLRYKNNINFLNKILQQDENFSSAHKYTERVIECHRERNNNKINKMCSLKSPAANMPYSEYFMYDTVLSIIMNHVL